MFDFMKTQMIETRHFDDETTLQILIGGKVAYTIGTAAGGSDIPEFIYVWDDEDEIDREGLAITQIRVGQKTTPRCETDLKIAVTKAYEYALDRAVNTIVTNVSKFTALSKLNNPRYM